MSFWVVDGGCVARGSDELEAADGVGVLSEGDEAKPGRSVPAWSHEVQQVSGDGDGGGGDGGDGGRVAREVGYGGRRQRSPCFEFVHIARSACACVNC